MRLVEIVRPDPAIKVVIELSLDEFKFTRVAVGSAAPGRTNEQAGTNVSALEIYTAYTKALKDMEVLKG